MWLSHVTTLWECIGKQLCAVPPTNLTLLRGRSARHIHPPASIKKNKSLHFVCVWMWSTSQIKPVKTRVLNKTCMNHSCHITSGRHTPYIGLVFISWINMIHLKVQAALNLLSTQGGANPRGRFSFNTVMSESLLLCDSVRRNDKMPRKTNNSPSILSFMGPDDR